VISWYSYDVLDNGMWKPDPETGSVYICRTAEMQERAYGKSSDRPRDVLFPSEIRGQLASGRSTRLYR